MDFASIWVILKAESCWAALILYRIVEVRVRGEPEPVSLSVRRYVFFVSFLSLHAKLCMVQCYLLFCMEVQIGVFNVQTE